MRISILKSLSFVLGLVALPLTMADSATPEIQTPVIKNCADYFEELRSKLGTMEAADTLDESRLADTATVQVVKQIEGKHGGQLLVVEKVGERWGSSITSVKYDPQGDPRWFIETVGPKAADFFGFKVIDDTHITVPNFREFESALKIVNKELNRLGKEPIAINFYDTGTNTNVSVSDYTNAFLNKRGLPMAPSGNHLFHDLSFHTGAIFLPKRIVDYKAALLQYHKDFFVFLHKKYADSSEEVKKAIRYYEYQMNMQATTSIDNGTGLLGPGIMNYLKRNETERSWGPEKYLETAIGSLIPGTRAGKSAIKWDLEGMFYSPLINQEKIGTHQKSFSKTQLLEDFETFSKSYASKNFPTFNQEESIASDWNTFVMQICKEITEKRKTISDTVESIVASRNSTRP